MSTVREAASKLLKLKLIEQVAEAIAIVDADFMDTLRESFHWPLVLWPNPD